MSMRLRSIEVAHFAGIESAEVRFQPGLNVLYGPNDLGKSTLVRAIRAALLVQHNSSFADVWYPWQGGGSPHVILELEVTPDGADEPKIYRIDKVFGRKAGLEERLPSSGFRTVARNRDVDAVLREEILRWGIRKPGKGAKRGLPDSFLATVLLGPQDDVDGLIQRTSLAEDDSESARDWLTRVLEASAVDPLFAEIQRTVETRYAEAFTETGKQKRAQDAPLVAIDREIKGAEAELAELEAAVANAATIRARVSSCVDQHVAAEQARDAAAESLAAARTAAEAAKAAAASRAGAVERSAEAERRLAEARARADRHRAATADVEHLDDAVEAAASWSETAERAVREAAEAAEAARMAQRAAEREAAAETGEKERERLAATLSAARNRADALRRRVETIQEVNRRSVENSQARREARARETRLAEIAARLEAIDEAVAARAARARGLKARQWAGALQRIALRRATAQAAAVERRERIAQAEAEAEGAAAKLAALDAREVPSAAVVDALRELASDLRAAEARLQVGLDLAVIPTGELELSVTRDGAADAPQTIAAETRWTADGQLSIEIPGVATIAVSAGAADDRAAADALRTRWRNEAEPLLGAAEVTELDALARLVRETEETRRTLHDANARAVDAGAKAAADDSVDREMAALDETQATLDAAIDEAGARDPDHGTALRAEIGTCIERRLASAAAIEDALVPLEEALAELDEAAASDLAERAALTTERATEEALLGKAVEAREASRAALQNYEDELVQNAAATMARAEQEEAALAREIRDLEAAMEKVETSSASPVDAAVAGAEVAAATEFEVRARRDRVREGAESLRTSLAGARATLAHTAEAVDDDDLDALEAGLAAARAALEDTAPPALPDVAAAETTLAAATGEVRRIELELAEARALLTRVGGRSVQGAEAPGRVTLTEARDELAERLAVLRAREREMILDYEAWALLRDTMRAVEEEETANLGAALGPLVGDRFASIADAVSGRRYGLDLAADFSAGGIVAAGAPREATAFSLGTREQLATLYRLTLAERLGSVLVLDDQLVQSDTDRMAPLTRMLAEVGEQIQILVFTCRPTDYRFAHAHTVDLAHLIQRA